MNLDAEGPIRRNVSYNMMDSTSILQCFKSNGNFDVEQYIKLRAKRRAATTEEIVEVCMSTAAEEESVSTRNKRSRTRDVRGQMPKKLAADGITMVPIDPQETPWWSMYVASPALNNKSFVTKFRRRFRMPYQQFLELCEDVREDQLFERWTKTDAAGKPSSPIELLLLGTLRYLGRGFTFDDCEENTAISEETHRRFFHVFIEFGSTKLFKRYVVAPASKEQAQTHQHEFHQAGMPGCVGSTDATHIAMLRCPSQLRNYNMGHKLDLPTRTYNLTTNHRRRILSTTTGHPGRWNDYPPQTST